MCGRTAMLLTFLATAADAGTLRTWTSSTGTAVKARMIRFDELTVDLEISGRAKRIEITKLNEDDRNFMARLIHDRFIAMKETDQGVIALNNSLFRIAKSRFEKAGKTDMHDPRPFFALGILAIGFDKDVDVAATHFKEAADRLKTRRKFFTYLEKRNYAAALNNLALISIRKRRMERAISLWTQAIELLDETPQEIIQNIGTAIQLGSIVNRNLQANDVPLTKKNERALDRLIGETKLTEHSIPHQPNVAWLYMTLLESPRDELPSVTVVVHGQASVSNSLVITDGLSLHETKETASIHGFSVLVTKHFNAFEDRLCMACHGTQQLACGCKNGIHVRYVTDRIKKPFGGRIIYIDKKRKVTSKCTTCNGNGHIDCRFSSLGIDRRFINYQRATRTQDLTEIVD